MYDQYDIPTNLDRFDGSMAIVDGYVVPEPPFEAFASGFKMDVPFLVGSAGQEMDGSKPPDDMGTWNKPDYERFVHQRLLTFSPHVADMALKLYPVTANTSARYQWASMVSDIRVNCGNNYLALVAARTLSSPVYRYVNTNRPSKPFGDGGGSIYPFHTHDVYAFFGSLNQYLSPLSASDTAFEQNMRNEVLSFVRTGHPKTAAWSSFPGSTGLISEVVRTVPEYHQPECEFFFANGLWPYSWRQ
ncbi:hypothetical protein DPMN_074259 [Dreissena polymorpha]|uniref:Carboxylesterase type B domain-containing protein n=2 Tax=Dreissena polymorpha TaxID=45954 RepID=A0A9D4BLE6_DREPO|nr:hypothetical protein DPMN_074259 [Dreissena polymorpha]